MDGQDSVASEQLPATLRASQRPQRRDPLVVPPTQAQAQRNLPEGEASLLPPDPAGRGLTVETEVSTELAVGLGRGLTVETVSTELAIGLGWGLTVETEVSTELAVGLGSGLTMGTEVCMELAAGLGEEERSALTNAVKSRTCAENYCIICARMACKIVST